MKMFIHSSFGVLDCVPMTLQAIENSIPDSIVEKTEKLEQEKPTKVEIPYIEGDECPF